LHGTPHKYSCCNVEFFEVSFQGGKSPIPNLQSLASRVLQANGNFGIQGEQAFEEHQNTVDIHVIVV
jgi:hypothetical protein